MRDANYYKQRVAELDSVLRDPTLSQLARHNLENHREYALRKIAEIEYLTRVIQMN